MAKIIKRKSKFTAKRVRELRDTIGLTQQQFADKLGVGLASVQRWEGGTYQPSPLSERILERLARENDV